MKLHDKPNCRVYPSDTQIFEATFASDRVAFRRVDVVRCFAWETEMGLCRFGFTADTNKPVEIFEGYDGKDADWCAIEAVDDQP